MTTPPGGQIRLTKRRQRVYERDEGVCIWCGRKLRLRGTQEQPLLATVDHVVPFSRSKYSGIDNLVIACRRCNNARGAWDVRRFARWCRKMGFAVDYRRLHQAVDRVGGYWSKDCLILPARRARPCTVSWSIQDDPGYRICGEPGLWERYYQASGKRNREPRAYCARHAFRDETLADAAGTALHRAQGPRLTSYLPRRGTGPRETPPLPRPMTGMVRTMVTRQEDA